MASFSVVTTVRSPKHHVEQFVAHYKKMGAERIYLFYDDPAFNFPVNRPGVREVVCDSDYWAGPRPDSIEKRQRRNGFKAVSWSSAEWILHCDIDELVHGEERLDIALEKVPQNAASVLAPPLEAVYLHEPSQHNVFATRFFKNIMTVERGYHDAVWQAYGPITRLTTGGFWGHIRGKSFYRREFCTGGLPIHKWDKPPNGDESLTVNHLLPGVNLLHFETMTFIDWKIKHLRRLEGAVLATEMGERRKGQLELVRRARDRWGEWGLHDLYWEMTVFDGERMTAALESSFVVEIDR